MSIELELEDDGTIKVKVDRDGERAVSDHIDPYELIKQVCTEADITCVVGDEELHILLPIKELEGEEHPVEELDAEEGESAQEDDNV